MVAYTDQESDYLERAVHLAAEAHATLRRPKGTNEPYIFHPMRVAGALTRMGKPATTAAAAVLHDSIEDTWVTTSSILCLRRPEDPPGSIDFWTRVAEIVDALTRREESYGEYVDRLISLGDQEVLDVKRQDLIDNLYGCPKSLSKRYLDALVRVGLTFEE